MSDLNYPDIEFIDTNPDTSLNRMVAKYEKTAERKLYASDPARLFISFMTNVVTQIRVELNETAKKNLPRYAAGEILESLGELFYDIQRNKPEAASVTLRFTISMPQVSAVLIPENTAVTVDGDINFYTLENAYINPGETVIDLKAVCGTAGTAGNGFVPGQIFKIVNPFPYFNSVVNITESAGGTDIETDAEMKRRMRKCPESLSTAGPADGYAYHAGNASAQISDVRAVSDKEGVVTLRVLCKNGELPSDEILNKVKEAVSGDKVRPLTDIVEVLAPDSVPFKIDFTYYISRDKSSDAAMIEKAVETAVQNYKTWQTSKIGRDINPSCLISLVMNAGVKRIDITEPHYFKISESQVPVLNGLPVTRNGGVEDD